jgi:hypothetical protein
MKKKFLFIGIFLLGIILIPKNVFAAQPYTGALNVNLVRAYPITGTPQDTTNNGLITYNGNQLRRVSFFFKGTSYCQNPTDVATFTGYFQSLTLGVEGNSTSMNISGAVLKDGSDNIKAVCKTTSISCSPGNVATTNADGTKTYSKGATCSYQVSCKMEAKNNTGISCNDYDNILEFALAYNSPTGESFRAYLNELWYNSSSDNADVVDSINGLKDKQQETNDKIKETNDTIKDSNTSKSEAQANDFFKNFKSDDHGLSGIITAPLTAIKKLTQSCVALSLPLPNDVGNIELPCMQTLYSQYVPTILSLWHVVVYGLVAYWIYKDIFRIVNNIKNPQDDKVEVLDL